MVVFFCLGGFLVSSLARPLPVRLLSDSAYAQLVPGRPTRASPLSPQVLYREEVMLQNGEQRAKLRFYSDEDPANPPLWFHVSDDKGSIAPVRERAPEELVSLGEKTGHPMLYAWTIPIVFEAQETKRLRIQAAYPVFPVSNRPKNDRFEIYFCHWGWQPSSSDLLFRFDFGPMISAIPCLGRSPTPALVPWLLSSWFLVQPSGYESNGFTVRWRFGEAGEPDRCEKICVEWYAWYR